MSEGNDSITRDRFMPFNALNFFIIIPKVIITVMHEVAAALNLKPS